MDEPFIYQVVTRKKPLYTSSGKRVVDETIVQLLERFDFVSDLIKVTGLSISQGNMTETDLKFEPVSLWSKHSSKLNALTLVLLARQPAKNVVDKPVA